MERCFANVKMSALNNDFYGKIFNSDTLEKFAAINIDYTHFFISTWPFKHMKAFFSIKHIKAHEGFCRKK